MTKRESGVAPRTVALGLAAALSVIGHALAAACPAPDAAAGGPVNTHTRYLETTMLPSVADEDSKPRTPAERMAAWQVPGVTVAVIEGGKLDWARGRGVRDASTCAPVTPETAFQAASISEPVFAMVVMKLAEAGTLDIDADIATQLTSWTARGARDLGRTDQPQAIAEQYRRTDHSRLPGICAG